MKIYPLLDYIIIFNIAFIYFRFCAIIFIVEDVYKLSEKLNYQLYSMKQIMQGFFVNVKLN